ncbi:hypothetical protein GJ496_009416 [Pomphorhynchus laevis]|nr:hypothetical protein GJ496_009416 [Pomphorhynchus laevis]
MSSQYFRSNKSGGVSAGAKAVVHVCRTQVRVMPIDKDLLKLDFTNSFNNICSSAILLEASLHILAVCRFIAVCYEDTPMLFYGPNVLLSQEGFLRTIHWFLSYYRWQ